MEILGVSETAL